jgi:hypothetical protein
MNNHVQEYLSVLQLHLEEVNLLVVRCGHKFDLILKSLYLLLSMLGHCPEALVLIQLESGFHAYGLICELRKLPFGISESCRIIRIFLSGSRD